ncbi:hypothetical protein [Rhizobium ruizarguesonis]|uniref:hypothetical protein n=1 Tax=Rhizobium ruizarguesonis TaxID=2081791 RepID=UPI002E1633BB|nr:hypothetical protein U8Q07_02030 [Rhizobium ruizarguesonis]WSH34116.1 hypothetical protein U8P70_02030 [Rhizobium ruizarguesonis]
MAEILTVLTYKSAHHIVADGGTQSWVISQRRARRCTYVVCVRHQHGPYKAEGSEPHKHAFLVGRVSDVVPSSETKDRFRVEISEYAIIDGPQIPLNSASPTQYFPSLSSIGIDEASLDWKPSRDIPGENISASRLSLSIPKSGQVDTGNGEGVATMSVIMQAKKLVSDGLQVPLSAVEIIVRG